MLVSVVTSAPLVYESLLKEAHALPPTRAAAAARARARGAREARLTL